MYYILLQQSRTYIVINKFPFAACGTVEVDVAGLPSLASLIFCQMSYLSHLLFFSFFLLPAELLLTNQLLRHFAAVVNLRRRQLQKRKICFVTLIGNKANIVN